MAGRNILVAILLAVSTVYTAPAFAAGSDNSPIGVAIVPPLQIPNSDSGVKGLRLGLLGINREVYGLDIGLLGNVTNIVFKGIAISGLFNYNRGTSSVIGLQLAGLANVNSGANSVYGVQIAAYNNAGAVYGFQIGLVNVATDLHGVQIGLLNFNKTGIFHVTPIINVGF